MAQENNYTQYLKELYGDKVPVKPEYPPIKKIYLASSMSGERLEYIKTAAEKLRARGYEVYVPMEHQIPNALDYPNNEWGLMVFTEDIHGITMCDCVVMLNYGRTENNRIVNFKPPVGVKNVRQKLIGQMVDMRITQAMTNTLRGDLAMSEAQIEAFTPMNYGNAGGFINIPIAQV